MATSSQFAVATSKAEDPPSKKSAALPAGIAAAAVVVVLIVAGSIWFCWFRKRRRRIRTLGRSPSLGGRHRSFPFSPRSRATSGSSIRKPQPQVEEGLVEKKSPQRESVHVAKEVVRKSPQRRPVPPPTPPQPLPPPPPLPVEETAELPLFVTPRSSRQLSNPSRQPSNHSRRAKVAAELDASPSSVSARPKSANDAGADDCHIQRPPPTRRSKRLSLQQVFHLKSLPELEGANRLSPHPSERSAQSETHRIGQGAQIQRSQSTSTRRSKRRSLHQLFHHRRVAELEGSSTLPKNFIISPPANSNTPAHPDLDEESQNPSPRRSRRLSLHRLLHSSRLAELEANTDILPEYSHTDQNRTSYGTPPPLPAKDVDFKAKLPVPQSTRRAISPVELDASEPLMLSSPSVKGSRSIRSPNHSIAGLVGSSSTSPVPPKASEDLNSSEWENGDSAEELLIPLQESLESHAGAPVPRTPDALEFLDLASTESEDGYGEDLDLVFDDTVTSLNNLDTPNEDNCMDPFLTAEIIAEAVTSSRHSHTSRKPDNTGDIHQEEQTEEELPTIHEMDAIESAIRRRSKRQSAHALAMRHDAHKKRPDFVTFKKQMSEAERRAKMIARRRRSRRRLTPKSF